MHKFFFKLGKSATENSRLLEVGFAEHTMDRTQVFKFFPCLKAV
jgi:hypothetical protein